MLARATGGGDIVTSLTSVMERFLTFTLLLSGEADSVLVRSRTARPRNSGEVLESLFKNFGFFSSLPNREEFRRIFSFFSSLLIASEDDEDELGGKEFGDDSEDEHADVVALDGDDEDVDGSESGGEEFGVEGFGGGCKFGDTLEKLGRDSAKFFSEEKVSFFALSGVVCCEE